jgi:hypothetical protein
MILEPHMCDCLTILGGTHEFGCFGSEADTSTPSAIRPSPMSSNGHKRPFANA